MVSPPFASINPHQQQVSFSPHHAPIRHGSQSSVHSSPLLQPSMLAHQHYLLHQQSNTHPTTTSNSLLSSPVLSGGLITRPVTVKLRGLPYTATTDDIAAFFHGYELVGGSVHIGTNREGRPSGEAWVDFASAKAAQRAVLERNKQHMGSRYIELFLQA